MVRGARWPVAQERLCAFCLIIVPLLFLVGGGWYGRGRCIDTAQNLSVETGIY